MPALIETPWCPIDLRKECYPPVIFTERSAANTDAAIEQFAGLGRYVARDLDGQPGDETCCNVFVTDTCAAQGVAVPRSPDGNYMRANAMVDYFNAQTALGGSSWARIPPWISKQLVRCGAIIVVGWKNPAGPVGHVARLKAPRPDDDPEGWYIGQAGLSNFTHDVLGRGFGARAVQFFAHP